MNENVEVVLENKIAVFAETPDENIAVEEKKESKRIKSIDRFRGFCVFAMLIFQFLKEFPSLGFLSRLAQHSLDKGIIILPGMTLADIIAPAFIFAIGLTYALSYNKYKKSHGRKEAYIRYALRGLSIIGVGTFLSVVNRIIDVAGGDKFSSVDIVFLAFACLAVVAVLVKLICLIPQLKNKAGRFATLFVYCALSLLGAVNLIIACIDFASLVKHFGDGTAMVYGYWVTLQNIGMACLVALPLVEAKNHIRFIVATVIFIAFSVYHQQGDNQALLDVVVHGGFLGGFGWGAMLIYDLMIADLFFKKDKSLVFTVPAVFLALGVWSTMLFGNINLGSCSPSFILVGVGLSGVIFSIFYLADKLPHTKFDPLVWWGKNPLVMFLVEFFIIGGYEQVVFTEEALHSHPAWLASIEGIVAVVALTFISYLLSKKEKSISL